MATGRDWWLALNAKHDLTYNLYVVKGNRQDKLKYIGIRLDAFKIPTQALPI